MGYAQRTAASRRRSESGQGFRLGLFQRRWPSADDDDGGQIFAGPMGCRLRTKASGVEAGQRQWRPVTGLQSQPRWAEAGDEYRVKPERRAVGHVDAARYDQWARNSDNQNLGTKVDDGGGDEWRFYVACAGHQVQSRWARRGRRLPRYDAGYVTALFRRAAACHRSSEQDQNVGRSEEHTSELQSLTNLVCRLLLEKKKHHT